MSLQSIRNALFNHFATCGPYAVSEMSTCSFGVLETAATCALTFFPGTDSNFSELSGTELIGLDEKDWAIAGSVYIRDSGDAERLLSLAWQAHDDLFNTLSKDRSLAGAANNARLVRLSFDPRVGVNAGGAFWAEVRWTLRATEYARH